MNGPMMALPRDGLKDGKGNPLTYDEIAHIGAQDSRTNLSAFAQHGPHAEVSLPPHP